MFVVQKGGRKKERARKEKERDGTSCRESERKEDKEPTQIKKSSRFFPTGNFSFFVLLLHARFESFD